MASIHASRIRQVDEQFRPTRAGIARSNRGFSREFFLQQTKGELTHEKCSVSGFPFVVAVDCVARSFLVWLGSAERAAGQPRREKRARSDGSRGYETIPRHQQRNCR